jgi:2-dehydro-3-deoxyphosphogluconate aldolase/(4S)-4-hydroxy-2-oxoglutarate aldolase
VPIPGVATATEVALARAAGIELLKLFPGGPLRIEYMRALHGPFEDAKFIPTGGIDPEEAGARLAAGAIAVGFGSLIPPRPTDADLTAIEAGARTALRSAAEARRRAGLKPPRPETRGWSPPAPPRRWSVRA